MGATLHPAIVELLSWIARSPRSYAETMEAWRSSCPRLTTWGDALLSGFVQVQSGVRLDLAAVTVTALGDAALSSATRELVISR